MIATTKVTVQKCDVVDVDNAITSFLKEKGFSSKNFDKYGYEAIAENEWSNYQEHSFSVEPTAPDASGLADIGRLSTGKLLNWMCADGKLPAGDYLVEVYW